MTKIVTRVKIEHLMVIMNHKLEKINWRLCEVVAGLRVEMSKSDQNDARGVERSFGFGY